MGRTLRCCTRSLILVAPSTFPLFPPQGQQVQFDGLKGLRPDQIIVPMAANHDPALRPRSGWTRWRLIHLDLQDIPTGRRGAITVNHNKIVS